MTYNWNNMYFYEYLGKKIEKDRRNMKIADFIRKIKGTPKQNNNQFYICGKDCGCDKQYFNVYLAGGISGKTYNEANGWREYVEGKLHNDIFAVNPMRVAKNTGNVIHKNDYYDPKMNTDNGIYNRDTDDVRNSDALLVNFLDSSLISFGTAMEIGIADQMNKDIVVCIEEGNPNYNPMLVGCPNVTIVKTLDEGIDLINDMFTKPEFLNKDKN